MSSEQIPLSNDASPAPINPLAAHPVRGTADLPASNTNASQDAQGQQPSSAAAASPELAGGKVKLQSALRHFADFPIKGIDFVDIMPLFLDPSVHETLGSVLELQVKEAFGQQIPDVVVGLDARGFLFGPGLALRLGTGFAPVRKQGKLPGPCVTAEYQKEYGSDFFQMQQDAIKPGQKVLVVDDIIATGGSAKAAADLVKQLGGEIVGYLFILEIPGLNGREKLGDTKTVILLEDA
ncbi:Adenine phosphoribosyltransferase [Colletotrichum siamense]|uniref:Adenine phosphoribosyltransferase n=1 Tax=Colletotrichum siamense TaxID=690259 RepID=UPI0018726CFE|nr:Adenine phosphoribosyltransferase [Colletotrichum siamense]KAF4833274.1 Adenine phosphoribosyltransferase [Colletotrichum tropicale]KAI8155107.1 Adenine phosphoribosyltransferase [Colletotrichum sp. SAR 10_65]KAI8160043.1 Adenine phosphoribosyltransferase [Colletotrichum sp. SAR 10_70]KAI8162800.1 Adenine phosphoribosyltransferase [Colletotrichum sp. SAR 10_71]KAI8181681.1 Adenine phosphoribosyltransferase [Colletotrichum sp. SAR 10_75]KAI8201270.1 Adenine phosphoribosyltransferase [Collet